MSAVCRDPAAPLSCFGGKHDYPTGKGCTLYGTDDDLCQYGSCRVVLSRYNPRDVCLCHAAVGKKRVPRKRGEAASAGGTAVTNAAPPPRRVTQEDIEMQAARRQEGKELRLRLRTFAATKGSTWFTSKEAQQYAECSNSFARNNLGELVKSGVLESHPRKGYRMRSDPVAKAAEAACDIPVDKTDAKVTSEPDAASSEDEKSAIAPEAPPGAAPATTERDPEQPAATPPAAPVSGTSQESPAAGDSGITVEQAAAALTAFDSYGESIRKIGSLVGQVPFAGVDPAQYRAGWAEQQTAEVELRCGQFIVIEPDLEMRVLTDLAALTPEQRERVLQFAVAKWWLP